MNNNQVSLVDILPKIEIFQKIDREISFTVIENDNLDRIIKLKPKDIFQIGITSWDMYCNNTPSQDKMVFASECQRMDPLLYKKVRRVIGETVINDIVYIKGEVQDDKIADPVAIEFMAAHIYPNCLIIADVMMGNPYKPVYPQQFDFQKFKGIGLFSKLLDNAKVYCRLKGINEICLTAADMPLKSLFEKHGFSVPNTWMGKAALEIGYGIPMVLNL
ncbi:MAG: GNAT family N-acetyltransferase [Serratia bockelmannii]